MLLEEKNNPDFQLNYLIDFLKLNLIDNKQIVLLGLDIGANTIGVATWRYDTKVAIPNLTIKRAKIEIDLKAIHDIVISQRAIALVIGTNYSLSQHDSKLAMVWTQKWPTIPLIYTDERFTTSLAHTLMRGVGFSRKKRHQVDNEVAASIFLGDFGDRLVKKLNLSR